MLYIAGLDFFFLRYVWTDSLRLQGTKARYLKCWRLILRLQRWMSQRHSFLEKKIDLCHVMNTAAQVARLCPHLQMDVHCYIVTIYIFMCFPVSLHVSPSATHTLPERGWIDSSSYYIMQKRVPWLGTDYWVILASQRMAALN